MAWLYGRVGRRLGAGFGVVLALVLLMLVAALYQLSRIRAFSEENRTHNERLVLVQEWASQVRTNLERAILSTRLDAAAGQDEAVRARLSLAYNRLAEAMSETANANAELAKRVRAASDEPTVARMIEQIETARQRFVGLRGQIGDDLQLGEGAARIDAQLQPMAMALLHSLDELVAYLREQSARATAEQQRHVLQARLVLTALTLLALLAGATIAWATTRAITQPMQVAVQAVDRIAQGDLSHPVHSERQDEIGVVLQRLGQMQQGLRRAFEEISHATGQIAQAGSEVAAGSADLAQRTEHAASNLQATAASMHQLTASARQSAAAAQQAQTLAESSSMVAQRGGQAVAQVVRTMQDIHASSQQIASIIGVIDGIAFQTNILALNAAVEAARAGEAGRGFAVVASEVRNLAQRAAEAAREIKALIDASVQRVDVGAAQVQQAGATMDEIVGSVRQVTELILGLGAAAGGQSQSIDGVNAAVDQLEQVTQQNAALVEQSSAAAHSLKEQTERLAAIVGRFRLA